MKQIYINALILLDFRIKQCGKVLQASLEPEALDYWQVQLALAQTKRHIVLARSGLNNVIFVDFKAKKRAS